MCSYSALVRNLIAYADFLTMAAIALVTFTRDGANKRELKVVKGEYLEILNMDRKWWKVRNKTQEVSD